MKRLREAGYRKSYERNRDATQKYYDAHNTAYHYEPQDKEYIKNKQNEIGEELKKFMKSRFPEVDFKIRYNFGGDIEIQFYKEGEEYFHNHEWESPKDLAKRQELEDVATEAEKEMMATHDDFAKEIKAFAESLIGKTIYFYAPVYSKKDSKKNLQNWGEESWSSDIVPADMTSVKESIPNPDKPGWNKITKYEADGNTPYKVLDVAPSAGSWAKHEWGDSYRFAIFVQNLDTGKSTHTGYQVGKGAPEFPMFGYADNVNWEKSGIDDPMADEIVVATE